MTDEPRRGPCSAAARVLRGAACLLACGLGLGGLPAAYSLYLVSGPLFARTEPALPNLALMQPTTTGDDEDTPGLWPGIVLPPARPADEAGIGDDEDVIGVCAGGKARAYLVRVMGWPATRHVVNDLLGGRAVTVTYCDRTHCARVFTGGTASVPLRFDVGGWLRHGLALRVGDADYAQTTGQRLDDPAGGPIPYAQLPHERTSWKAWREAHPDTDIYVGDPPPADESSGPAGD